MDELAKESTRRSFWPEDDRGDGYGDDHDHGRHHDDHGHDRESGYRDRVIDAIGEFLGSKKRRRR